MSAPLKIDIHQLPHGAGLPLPAYQSAHASGLDLLAAVAEDAPLVLERLSHGIRGWRAPRGPGFGGFGAFLLSGHAWSQMDYTGRHP